MTKKGHKVDLWLLHTQTAGSESVRDRKIQRMGGRAREEEGEGEEEGETERTWNKKELWVKNEKRWWK